MDIEFMKSAAEDQMEMMLMQMDKIPEFSGTTYETPMIEFTNHNQNNNHMYTNDSNNNIVNDNMHVSSPTFIPSTISFSDGSFDTHTSSSKRNSMAAMREMIFRMAAMQPIHIDPESVKPPKRRNVKISNDPQSVAARHRRERISERIRILQRLVPGGTKMDTASMLDEAIHYVKFLKNQVQTLERVGANRPVSGVGFPVPMTSGSGYFPGKGCHERGSRNVQH